MSKPPTQWANTYGAGVLEMRDTSFQGKVKSSQIQRVLLECHGLESSWDDISGKEVSQPTLPIQGMLQLRGPVYLTISPDKLH